MLYTLIFPSKLFTILSLISKQSNKCLRRISFDFQSISIAITNRSWRPSFTFGATCARFRLRPQTQVGFRCSQSCHRSQCDNETKLALQSGAWLQHLLDITHIGKCLYRRLELVWTLACHLQSALAMTTRTRVWPRTEKGKS